MSTSPKDAGDLYSPPKTFSLRLKKLALRLKKLGFSLVEVCLALSIIAIAFIVLMGMLPVGMKTFRESRDSSNEMWILQMLQAKIQATDWKNLIPGTTGEKGLLIGDNKYKGEEYYYDVEGRFVQQTGGSAFNLDSSNFSQTYKAKILNGPATRTQAMGSSGSTATQGQVANASMFGVALVALSDKKAVKAFDAIENMDQLFEAPKSVRVRTFLVTRMDSDNDR